MECIIISRTIGREKSSEEDRRVKSEEKLDIGTGKPGIDIAGRRTD